jgi:glutamate synthase (NADPH/NADH) small chain
MACAQQLRRDALLVSLLFEKADRIGGLLRYGIPDFKMDKYHIDRRVEQMRAEGVEFRVNAHVGAAGKNGVSAARLLEEFDALVASAGSEHPRDLDVPGRDLDGVHFAMDFLPLQNRRVAGDADVPPLTAKGRHVIVIGGGDTGSDCVGTSNRQGALSVTQFELLPQPPEHENKPLVWPYWPMKMRTSSSHEEGCERDWAVQTKAFKGEGKVVALVASRVEWKDGKLREVPGSEFELKADLVRSRWVICIRCTSGCSKSWASIRRARQRQGRHRALSNVGPEAVCCRRHAPRPVAGRLGNTRGPPVRARRRRIPDGRVRAAALVHRFRQ